MKKALVLVNYEMWYHSAHNEGEQPKVKEIMASLEDRYTLSRLAFLGDFSKAPLKNQISALNVLPYNEVVVINTIDENHQENPLLFTMAEELFLYVTAIPEQDRNAHAVVLMNGDWRINGIAAQLAELNVELHVLGPEGTLNSDLKDIAFSFQEFSVTNPNKELYETLLREEFVKRFKSCEDTETPLAFKPFAATAAKKLKLKPLQAEALLSKMIDNGEVIRYMQQADDGKTYRLIKANWEKLN